MNNTGTEDVLRLINSRFDDISKTMSEMQHRIIDLARFEERLHSIDEKRKMDRQDLKNSIDTILERVNENSIDMNLVKESQIGLKMNNDNLLKVQEKTLNTLEKTIERIDKIEKEQHKSSIVSGGIGKVVWIVISGVIGFVFAILSGAFGV